jgi:EpsD family peptidyl-prolyl cis-trans isomerase
MKRMRILPLLLAALPLVAQQKAATTEVKESDKPVAVVNGQIITAGTLDSLWNGIGTQMRDQYKQNGGKAAFLTNYIITRRLMVQEALKHNFDKQPDVQAEIDAAKEKVLFDRYVRDVVASTVVTDAEIQKYYDEHPTEFAVPEKIKVRHIVMIANPTLPNGKTKEQALETMQKVFTELHAANMAINTPDTAAADRLRIAHFADLAKKYSMDGAAENGGDLGWVEKGALDPQFEEAAWKVPVGGASGIVETRYGYHLIFIEGKQPAGTEPFDNVKSSIREFLMAQHAADIMTNVTRLTNELRVSSKIAVYPENITR